MKQSQVRIMGAAASSLDPEKTRVDIDLVPLGEKFDNMTAFLTYERFWQGKVPINVSMFGDYQVIFVRYPGKIHCIFCAKNDSYQILLTFVVSYCLKFH